MFGISFAKLALLIIIVAAVWYGFKLLDKKRELRDQQYNRNKKQPHILLLIALAGLVIVVIIWGLQPYI